MKRYLIAGAIVAAMLLLLWTRRTDNTGTNATPEPHQEAVVAANSGAPPDGAQPAGERAAPEARSSGITTNRDTQAEETAPYYREFPDLPVAFYGLVLDQDSNALQHVKIDVEVTMGHQRLARCRPKDGSCRGANGARRLLPGRRSERTYRYRYRAH